MFSCRFFKGRQFLKGKNLLLGKHTIFHPSVDPRPLRMEIRELLPQKVHFSVIYSAPDKKG